MPSNSQAEQQREAGLPGQCSEGSGRPHCCGPGSHGLLWPISSKSGSPLAPLQTSQHFQCTHSCCYPEKRLTVPAVSSKASMHTCGTPPTWRSLVLRTRPQGPPGDWPRASLHCSLLPHTMDCDFPGSVKGAHSREPDPPCQCEVRGRLNTGVPPLLRGTPRMTRLAWTQQHPCSPLAAPNNARERALSLQQRRCPLAPRQSMPNSKDLRHLPPDPGPAVLPLTSSPRSMVSAALAALAP